MPLVQQPLKQNISDAEKLNMSFPFTGEPPLSLQIPPIPPIPAPTFPVIPDGALKVIAAWKTELSKLTDVQKNWLAAVYKFDVASLTPPIPQLPALPPMPKIPAIPNIPEFLQLKKIPSLGSSYIAQLESKIPKFPNIPKIPKIPKTPMISDAAAFITSLIPAEMLLEVPKFGSSIKLPQVPTPPPLPAMPKIAYDPKTLLTRLPNPNIKPPVLPQLPAMPFTSLSVGDIPGLLGIELPPVPKQMAMNYAMAYHRWVLQSMPMAGPLILDPSRLSSGVLLLAAQLKQAPFMLGWGPGLISYWGTANWVGPGYIPFNPVLPTSLMPPFGVDPEIAQLIAGSSENPPGSYDAAAGRLATVLFNYTMKIQVITTTVPPMGSVVAIVPIT